jgi:hypothetical protein
VPSGPEAPGAPDADWRARRADAATEHAKALDRRRAQESAQARELIAGFVAQAAHDGVEPVPLRARSYDGRHRYRTPLRGWYLRRNESVAIDTDGQFYILSVPASALALLRGATPVPSDPPLILGKGARDGESIDLVDALRLALEAHA